MPLDRPLTAEDILNYVPSESQRLHGFRVYASRLMNEGVRFEQSGNELQAKLRYEKCKAYCKLRGVAFPPFSEGKTALIEQVEKAQEPVKEWVRGEKVVVNRITRHGVYGEAVAPKLGRPPGSKNKKEKRQWNGNREEFKVRGKMIWFNRLLRAGKTEEAAAFARAHNLPTAGQVRVVTVSPDMWTKPEISGDETNVQGEPAIGAVVSPHSTLTPETVSAVVAPAPQSVPEIPFEKLSLREQLMRQIAEMDAAERAAGIPQVAPPVIKPEISVTVATVDEVKAKWDASQQTYDDVKAYAAALPKVEAVLPPASATRPAIIWNFALNPRLARIKFTDTTATEFGSMRLDRLGLKTNDKVVVEISEGVPGPNAIWRELRKKT